MKRSIKPTAKVSYVSRGTEFYGWLGSFLILAAYALLSIGLIDGNAPVYHILLLVGSSGLAVISYIRRAYQPFIVNLFFMLLATVALIRLAYFN